MALPEKDWLPLAKRCAVGMRMRVRHGNENRANMTVANEQGRWWAYCQRCKQGGVISKEHVLLGTPAYEPPVLTVPKDLEPVAGGEWEHTVGQFLASKNMMFPYLPPLWVSPSTKRLFLHDGQQWHGRDLTGRSNAKWLHFGAKFAGEAGPITVVTEDIFSMYKVQFAMRESRTLVSVASTLAAQCGDAAALALKNCKAVVWAYDGDDAGDAGFEQARIRMRAFGVHSTRLRPPQGLDPKDMDCPSLRAAVHAQIPWL